MNVVPVPKTRETSSNSLFDDNQIDFDEKLQLRSPTQEFNLQSPSNSLKTGLPRHIDSVFPNKDLRQVARALSINIWVGTCLAILGILLALIENEICYRNGFMKSQSTDVLRVIVLGISAVHWWVVYKYYSYHAEIAQAYGKTYPRSKRYSGSIFAVKSNRQAIIIDLLSISFSPPPMIYMHLEFSQVGTTATLSLGDMMLLLVMLRCLQIFKLFYLVSPLFRSRDSFIL